MDKNNYLSVYIYNTCKIIVDKTSHHAVFQISASIDVACLYPDRPRTALDNSTVSANDTHDCAVNDGWTVPVKPIITTAPSYKIVMDAYHFTQTCLTVGLYILGLQTLLQLLKLT